MVAETQLAQIGDPGADLLEVRREVDALGAALEHVLDLRAREMMQHDLHHGELVQVGVEQRLDDQKRSLGGDCNRKVRCNSPQGLRFWHYWI